MTANNLLKIDLDEEIGVNAEKDLGAMLALEVYLYDPEEVELTTWARSYSFHISPGTSTRVGLTTKKFKDARGYSGCIHAKTKGCLYFSQSHQGAFLCELLANAF